MIDDLLSPARATFELSCDDELLSIARGTARGKAFGFAFGSRGSIDGKRLGQTTPNEVLITGLTTKSSILTRERAYTHLSDDF